MSEADRIIRHVTRRRIDYTQSQDRSNIRTRIFMDVGQWGMGPVGRPNTDFGLVCGQYVLLCTWMNFENHARLPTTNYPEKIRHILDPVQAPDRGRAYREIRTRQPLTSEDEVILFLPDLHLNLFKHSVMDNFQYRPHQNPGDPIPRYRSLEEHLYTLLRSAEEQGAWVVQVGDCFEMWEAQIHLVSRHANACRILNERGSQLPADTRAGLRAICSQRKVPVEDRETIRDIERLSGHIIEDTPYSSGRISNNMDLAVDAFGWTPDDVSRDGIPFENSGALKEAIMNQYPMIFARIFPVSRYGGDRMHFVWLQGNHDNMLENTIYGDHYHLLAATDRQNVPPENVRINDIIWAEHGHALDENNNNDDFDIDRRTYGYYMTRFYTLNIETSGFGMSAVARDIAANFDGMRDAQIRRAGQIFSHYDNVRLVVMGHTHSAVLFDFNSYARELRAQRELMRESLDLGRRRPGEL